jgi:hypothetical protein
MLIKPKMTKEEFILNCIDEIYKSPVILQKKIAALIVIRRDNHGNDKIQNKCNVYLTKLYNDKYKELGGQK